MKDPKRLLDTPGADELECELIDVGRKMQAPPADAAWAGFVANLGGGGGLGGPSSPAGPDGSALPGSGVDLSSAGATFGSAASGGTLGSAAAGSTLGSVVVKSLATAGAVKALGIGAALGVLAVGTVPAARWVTKAEPATSSARALPSTRAEVSASGRAKLQQRTVAAPGAPEVVLPTPAHLSPIPTELAMNLAGEALANPVSPEPAHAATQFPTSAPVAGDAAALAAAVESGTPGSEEKERARGSAPASTLALDPPPDVPPLAPVPSLAPTPALAPSPTPVAAPSGPSTQAPLTPSLLQLEAAELAKAKNLLESGRAPAALALLEQSSRRFPRGALVQEREVLTIGALVRGGDQATARKRARVFLARYPQSLLADRIRAILGDGE